MGDPLTRLDPARMDAAGDGVLSDAAHRLERALQTLEAALGRPRDATPAPASGFGSAQVVELEAARRRGRELETAAAEASEAVGRAMAQVKQALDSDETGTPDPQTSLFDEGLLDSPLESGPVLPDEDDTEADESAFKEEPAA